METSRCCGENPPRRPEEYKNKEIPTTRIRPHESESTFKNKMQKDIPGATRRKKLNFLLRDDARVIVTIHHRYTVHLLLFLNY